MELRAEPLAPALSPPDPRVATDTEADDTRDDPVESDRRRPLVVVWLVGDVGAKRCRRLPAHELQWLCSCIMSIPLAGAVPWPEPPDTSDPCEFTDPTDAASLRWSLRASLRKDCALTMECASQPSTCRPRWSPMGVVSSASKPGAAGWLDCRTSTRCAESAADLGALKPPTGAFAGLNFSRGLCWPARQLPEREEEEGGTGWWGATESLPPPPPPPLPPAPSES